MIGRAVLTLLLLAPGPVATSSRAASPCRPPLSACELELTRSYVELEGDSAKAEGTLRRRLGDAEEDLRACRTKLDARAPATVAEIAKASAPGTPAPSPGPSWGLTGGIALAAGAVAFVAGFLLGR